MSNVCKSLLECSKYKSHFQVLSLRLASQNLKQSEKNHFSPQNSTKSYRSRLKLGILALEAMLNASLSSSESNNDEKLSCLHFQPVLEKIIRFLGFLGDSLPHRSFATLKTISPMFFFCSLLWLCCVFTKLLSEKNFCLHFGIMMLHVGCSFMLTVVLNPTIFPSLLRKGRGKRAKKQFSYSPAKEVPN